MMAAAASVNALGWMAVSAALFERWDGEHEVAGPGLAAMVERRGLRIVRLTLHGSPAVAGRGAGHHR
jgi:hypothetical protein